MTSLRVAIAADYESIVRLTAELGVPDPPPARDIYERRLMPTTLVVEQDDEVVGYVSYELLTDELVIRQLVIDPAQRRRGLARALLREVLDGEQGRKAARWTLNVKEDNAAATRALSVFEPRACVCDRHLARAMGRGSGLRRELHRDYACARRDEYRRRCIGADV